MSQESNSQTLFCAKCVELKEQQCNIVPDTTVQNVEVIFPQVLKCPDGYSGSLDLTCTNGEVSIQGSSACHKICPAGMATIDGVEVEHGQLNHDDEVDLACPEGYKGHGNFQGVARCFHPYAHCNSSMATVRFGFSCSSVRCQFGSCNGSRFTVRVFSGFRLLWPSAAVCMKKSFCWGESLGYF